MNQMESKRKVIGIGVICFLAVVTGLFLRWQGHDSSPKSLAEVESAEDWIGERKSSKEPVAAIQIPGYDRLELKAGETQQQVNFYNPKENGCYFRLSLWLDEKTKIWESKLLEPGKAIYAITLAQPVTAGNYEHAYISYECFALKTQDPLNGSDIHVTLEAK